MAVIVSADAATMHNTTSVWVSILMRLLFPFSSMLRFVGDLSLSPAISWLSRFHTPRIEESLKKVARIYLQDFPGCGVVTSRRTVAK
jgi:hypothetical protein